MVRGTRIHNSIPPDERVEGIGTHDIRNQIEYAEQNTAYRPVDLPQRIYEDLPHNFNVEAELSGSQHRMHRFRYWQDGQLVTRGGIYTVPRTRGRDPHAEHNARSLRQRVQEYGTIPTTQPPAAGGGETRPIYASTGGILPGANTTVEEAMDVEDQIEDLRRS